MPLGYDIFEPGIIKCISGQAKNICVVVPPAEQSRLERATNRCSNSGDFVGSNRHTDASSTNQNPELTGVGNDLVGDLESDIRVVARLSRMGAAIVDCVASRFNGLGK
jgi:hypothetical protein